jgi:hypothetical protein
MELATGFVGFGTGGTPPEQTAQRGGKRVVASRMAVPVVTQTEKCIWKMSMPQYQTSQPVKKPASGRCLIYF